MLLPEAPVSCGKKIEIIFSALYYICMKSKSFLKSYFKMEIFRSLSFMLSFLVICSTKKHFPDEKTAWETETHFSRKAIKVTHCKQRKFPSLAETGELQSFS